MPNSAHRSLVKAFEPSSRAAALRRAEGLDAGRREVVDEAGDERRLRSDHDEVDRRSSRQKAITAAWSATSSADVRAACAPCPGLPGAMNSRSQSGLADSAQASACSRPPEPMRRMFMAEHRPESGR